jgi:hypothetical protein
VQKHVQEGLDISVLRGFYAEPRRAEKHVQEDKRNMRWTELDWGVFSISHTQAPPQMNDHSLSKNCVGSAVRYKSQVK